MAGPKAERGANSGLQPWIAQMTHDGQQRVNDPDNPLALYKNTLIPQQPESKFTKFARKLGVRRSNPIPNVTSDPTDRQHHTLSRRRFLQLAAGFTGTAALTTGGYEVKNVRDEEIEERTELQKIATILPSFIVTPNPMLDRFQKSINDGKFILHSGPDKRLPAGFFPRINLDKYPSGVTLRYWSSAEAGFMQVKISNDNGQSQVEITLEINTDGTHVVVDSNERNAPVLPSDSWQNNAEELANQTFKVSQRIQEKPWQRKGYNSKKYDSTFGIDTDIEVATHPRQPFISATQTDLMTLMKVKHSFPQGAKDYPDVSKIKAAA